MRSPSNSAGPRTYRWSRATSWPPGTAPAGPACCATAEWWPRAAPEQKLQVIEALQAAGQVVAMVGDGANDAAAIRAADIGIAIAARGSAAARNAANLVITSDDVSILLAAAEGRALWRSVADAISVLIGGNAGEIGFSVLGTLLSGASPLSTRQIMLVNLLTDMFPTMAVAVTPRRDETTPDDLDDRGDPGDPGDATHYPAHDPDDPDDSDDPDDEVSRPDGTSTSTPTGLAALGDPLTHQIRERGIVTALGAGTAWLIGTLTPGSARRTSTMALCGVVGAQLTQTVTGRRHSPLVLATAVGSAAVLAVLIETPLISHFFGCRPLGPVAWAGVATAMCVAMIGPRWVPAFEGLIERLEATFREETS